MTRGMKRRGDDGALELPDWIATTAAEQGRCPLCLQKLSAECGFEVDYCHNPVASDAAAVAILHGMVQG